MSTFSRREFLVSTAAGMVSLPSSYRPAATTSRMFSISLAEWSFHKALRAKQMDNLDFAKVAKREFGIEAIEYVNGFFKDKPRDAKYLAELNRRASGEGVYQHLIMIDAEGALGDPDPAKRAEAVANHVVWVEAAKTLGCATIRVNAESRGTPEEQQKLAADGLRQLCEKADPYGINVIVENHGGVSSHGDWLAGVMRLVNHPRVGTLPDFGNFYDYDRYQGVTEMMPFAKAVSAKSHDFDARGDETTKDYRRLLKIVLDAGFRGWIGIEYEGERLSERDGVRATLRLLERLRAEFEKA